LNFCFHFLLFAFFI